MPDTDLDRAFDALVAEVDLVVIPPGADRTRSTVRNRRIGVAAVALLAVAAVGGATVATQLDEAPGHPQPTRQTVNDESALGGRLHPSAEIDGHWRTSHLSPPELRSLLGAAGRDDVLAWWQTHHPAGRARLTLAANATQGLGLWLGTDAQPYLKKLDWGSFNEHGNRVTLDRGYTPTPSAWLRATVTGARLDLDVVDSAWPSRNGVSGTEQVRALYASLPFTRFVDAGHY